jgi:hypothetical protein
MKARRESVRASIVRRIAGRGPRLARGGRPMNRRGRRRTCRGPGRDGPRRLIRRRRRLRTLRGSFLSGERPVLERRRRRIVPTLPGRGSPRPHRAERHPPSGRRWSVLHARGRRRVGRRPRSACRRRLSRVDGRRREGRRPAPAWRRERIDFGRPWIVRRRPRISRSRSLPTRRRHRLAFTGTPAKIRRDGVDWERGSPGSPMTATLFPTTCAGFSRTSSRRRLCGARRQRSTVSSTRGDPPSDEVDYSFRCAKASRAFFARVAARSGRLPLSTLRVVFVHRLCETRAHGTELG